MVNENLEYNFIVECSARKRGFEIRTYSTPEKLAQAISDYEKVSNCKPWGQAVGMYISSSEKQETTKDTRQRISKLIKVLKILDKQLK